MNGFQFLHGDRWPILVLLPVFVWVLWAAVPRLGVRAHTDIGPRFAALAGDRRARSGAEPFARGHRALRLLWVAGLVLALFAALGPSFGALFQPLRGAITRPGSLDIAICVDVSRSMLARDAGASRLQHAKAEVSRLLAHAPEQRYALILFAGDAVLAAPLTFDAAAIEARLIDAGPLSVALGGSDVGAALDVARESLVRGANDGRASDGVIVLIADGEDHAEGADAAAVRVHDAGAVLHTLSVGSTRGARIPIDLDGGGEAFLVDGSGAPVVTRAAPESLARWAARGGGELGSAGLVELFDTHMARRARETSQRAHDQVPDDFAWLLLPAFLCWLIEIAVRPGALATRTSPTVRVSGRNVSLGVMLVFVATEGWAAGVALYQEGNFEAARQTLERAKEGSQERGVPRALQFDLGLTSLRAGRVREARGLGAELAQSVEGDTQNDARRWVGLGHFVAGAGAYESARQLGALAAEPSRPPGMFDSAIADARAAFEAFQNADPSASYAGAVARNAERAARLVRDLEAARDAAAPPNDAPAPPDEQTPEPQQSPEEDPPEEALPRERALTAAELEAVFERLVAKDIEKRAARADARRGRNQSVERDW